MTGNEALLTFALIAGGFLLGGVMFSRALPKLLTGKDVCALRTDKNPGAANVFAVCGVPMGLLCLALVMLKGDVLAGIFSPDAEVVQKGFAYLKSFAPETIVTAVLFSILTSQGLDAFVESITSADPAHPLTAA